MILTSAGFAQDIRLNESSHSAYQHAKDGRMAQERTIDHSTHPRRPLALTPMDTSGTKPCNVT